MTHVITLAPLTTGTLVRYGEAPAALMRIDSIAYNHGGPGQHRYYGAQLAGGSHAAYHAQLRLANEVDRAHWHAAYPVEHARFG